MLPRPRVVEDIGQIRLRRVEAGARPNMTDVPRQTRARKSKDALSPSRSAANTGWIGLRRGTREQPNAGYRQQQTDNAATSRGARPSISSCRTIRQRRGPHRHAHRHFASAAAARASSRFATFAQAISSTKSDGAHHRRKQRTDRGRQMPHVARPSGPTMSLLVSGYSARAPYVIALKVGSRPGLASCRASAGPRRQGRARDDRTSPPRSRATSGRQRNERCRKEKSIRHDADDGAETPFTRIERPITSGRTDSDPARLRAEDHHRCRAFAIVIGAKAAAQHRPGADQTKSVRRNKGARNRSGAVPPRRRS